MLTMFEPVIELLKSSEDAAICAEMMAATDPWQRLGRDRAACFSAITDATRQVFVARIADAVVGFIILNLAGSFVGYIQTVCIAPSHRDQGLGSRLLGFAEDYIFQRTPNVFICVSSFNPDAQRLYERLGYSVVGELDDYIIPGASEILLRKSIGPLQGWTPRVRPIQ